MAGNHLYCVPFNHARGVWLALQAVSFFLTAASEARKTNVPVPERVYAQNALTQLHFRSLVSATLSLKGVDLWA